MQWPKLSLFRIPLTLSICNTHTHTRTYTHTHTHIHLYTHTYTYTHTHIHTYTHIYTLIHTYTHTIITVFIYFLAIAPFTVLCPCEWSLLNQIKSYAWTILKKDITSLVLQPGPIISAIVG